MQTTLTRIFIVLETVSHGLSENSDEISRKVKGFFSAQSEVFSKKKKKKKVFTKIETNFLAEIGNSKVFFPPKMRWSPKKKDLHRPLVATLLSLNITTIVVSYFFNFLTIRDSCFSPSPSFFPSPLRLYCLFVCLFARSQKKKEKKKIRYF